MEKRTIEELKEIIRKNISVKLHDTTVVGGQSCGLMPRTVVLKSEELSLEIIFGHNRSQLKNKEFVVDLFEVALDKIIK